MELIDLRQNPFRAAIVVGMAILASAGCGGGSSGPKMPTFEGEAIPVSGVVTLDGTPVEDAAVTFTYDGQAPSGFINGTGKTDSTGKYALQSGSKMGVPAGRYKVTVSKLATKDGKPFTEDAAGGLDFEQARMSGLIKESLPAKFSDMLATKLSATITSGQKDAVNFDLKTK